MEVKTVASACGTALRPWSDFFKTCFMLHFFRVTSFFVLIFATLPALAQAPTQEAIRRSDVIASEMMALFANGDAEGARRKAEEASARFKAEGEAWRQAR